MEMEIKKRRKIMIKKLCGFAWLIILCHFVVSCNFTATTTNAFDKVKAGMEPAQVLEAMGEPDSITKIEVWKYQEDDTTIDISIQDGRVINVRTFTIMSLKK